MATIVAIICPSCSGTNKGISGLPCMWCGGEKRLRKADAVRYANQSIMLGDGGYICGDHDWSDRCRMVNEGNKIRKTFGLEPRP